MQNPSTLEFRISNLEDLINDLLKFGNNEPHNFMLPSYIGNKRYEILNILVCGFLLRKADVLLA